MRKYRKILEKSRDFNEERELYILFQDEEIDKLIFKNLVAKCIIFIMAIGYGLLSSVIYYLQ